MCQHIISRKIGYTHRSTVVDCDARRCAASFAEKLVIKYGAMKLSVTAAAPIVMTHSHPASKYHHCALIRRCYKPPGQDTTFSCVIILTIIFSIQALFKLPVHVGLLPKCMQVVHCIAALIIEFSRTAVYSMMVVDATLKFCVFVHFVSSRN